MTRNEWGMDIRLLPPREFLKAFHGLTDDQLDRWLSGEKIDPTPKGWLSSLRSIRIRSEAVQQASCFR